MERPSQTPTLCSLHPKKPVKYYCFNTKCGNKLECCILCIKNVHKTCDDNFLLDHQSVVNLIKKAEPVDHETIHSFAGVYTRSITSVKTLISDIMSNNLQKLNDKCTSLGSFSSHSLGTKKSTYYFSYDKDSKKIIVTSVISPQNKNFQELVNDVDISLQNAIKVYNNGLKAYRLSNKIVFKADDFKHHSYLKLTDEDNNLVFSLPESSENYYLAIFQQPISGDFHFKIKVFNLNPSDRYVEVGFLSQTSYDLKKTSLTGVFLCGTVCYCGYRFKGFKESIPHLALSSEDGLQEGDEVYFKYDYNKTTLTVWSNTKGWKQTAKVTFTEPYYLYFCLYFLNQKFELTHL